MWPTVFKIVALGAAVLTIYLLVKNWNWITVSIHRALQERHLQSSQIQKLWLNFQVVGDVFGRGVSMVRVLINSQLALPALTQAQIDARAETRMEEEQTFDLDDVFGDADVQAGVDALRKEKLTAPPKDNTVILDEQYFRPEDIPDAEIQTLLKQNRVVEKDLTPIMSYIL